MGKEVGFLFFPLNDKRTILLLQNPLQHFENHALQKGCGLSPKAPDAWAHGRYVALILVHLCDNGTVTLVASLLGMNVTHDVTSGTCGI